MFRSLRQLLRVERGLCMVVAEQESSEIWIDGERTSYRTPKLVAIPKNRSVLLEVKRAGFETHQAWVRSVHDLSFHYCELKRIPLRLLQNENFEKQAYQEN